MRYAQGDLAILSAETYDPGSRPVPTRAKKTQQQPAARENARKRKTQSPDDGSDNHEDEEKKRSRGRPRLDTNDETAAERRRTQIRLAQRAYRNRKENAIHTLERRVQELQETNEEMSNAFMKLHDFAIGHGLLEAAPEFARQMRTTTQMFLSLARRSSDDGRKDEEQPAGEGQGASVQADQSVSSHPSGPTAPNGQDAQPAEAQLMGGLMVSHEPVPENKVASADMQLSLDVAGQNPNLDYEVITYPTLENASFPFHTDFSFSSGETTSSSTPLFREPPPPKSYAIQEATFGRRLHRTAAERALDLISMPNPPPRRFARVFGFCLLFESQESIRRRLQTAVNRNRQESLFNWEYPFLNLGGSGTHYDMTDFTGQSIGNQGTIDIRKPRSAAGFSTGPFGSKIMEASNLLDKGYRMDLPGFRADFYDCDEVEVYLRERGVAIPGGAEYVTAEIDLGDFEDTEEEANAAHPFDPPELLDPGKPEADLADLGSIGSVGDFAAALNAAHAASRSPSASTGDASTAITVPSPGPEAAKAWSMSTTPPDPLLDANYPAPTGNAFLDAVVTTGDFSSGNLLAFSGLGMLGQEGPKRRIVTIDVNMLIYEMIERAACLGRSPGLRKTDINAAFAIAARCF